LKKQFKVRNDVQLGEVFLFFFYQEKRKPPKGINYILSFLKILNQTLENQMKRSKKECDLV
jgi:hypothetical protein